MLAMFFIVPAGIMLVVLVAIRMERNLARDGVLPLVPTPHLLHSGGSLSCSDTGSMEGQGTGSAHPQTG
jgi:hypothetical protein